MIGEAESLSKNNLQQTALRASGHNGQWVSEPTTDIYFYITSFPEATSL